jgi:hypothetical protein
MCGKKAAAAKQPNRQFRKALRTTRKALVEQRKTTQDPHQKRVLAIQIRALFKNLQSLRQKSPKKT